MTNALTQIRGAALLQSIENRGPIKCCSRVAASKPQLVPVLEALTTSIRFAAHAVDIIVKRDALLLSVGRRKPAAINYAYS
jgi:hypothetical protein